MIKIGITLILLAMFCTPSFACSTTDTGITTGSACSIQDLNNLENSQVTKRQSGLADMEEPKREINLRPVRYDSEIRNLNIYDCLLGNCIFKSLLGK